ncbi:MAG TPA: putative lipid II flippase FtsW [Pyrinomonadaceae bacterium]|jgi:cell division protein FtsW|nr:putative lipid II flippase FtsW [Pyrinomonadaceae bacterium]
MARKLQADEWLFAATLGLALFGVVMVYSASADLAFAENGTQYHYVKRQAIWTVAGLLAMMGAMQVDYGWLRDRRVVAGLLAGTVVLLVAVFGFPRINGAHRWIRLGGFSLQPSELSKLALAVFLARFLERRAGEEHSLWKTFVPCVLMTGLLVMLVAAEPDLGTAMMLGIICVTLLFAAGVRLLYLGAIGAVGLVGITFMIVLFPWRLGRVTAFLDPWADAQGTGFQVVQSLIAVGSGGTNGLGFAQGRQKMLFLPFAHSDFIFAVVGEELGLLGALTLVSVFGLFLWRGVRAVRRAPDRFGMLLGLGIVVGIVAQALFNISVVLSLVPTKGIPLPFISYGGSSMMLTLVSVGVLLNISQQGTAQGDAATRKEFATANVPAKPRRERVPATQTWRPEGRS